MAKSDHYTVVSADGHCGADLWEYKPYLEKRYHDEFDAWAKSYVDAWAPLDADAGERRIGAASYSSNYNWDSQMRLLQMEKEGIVAEVLFPNTSPPFYPTGAITAPPPSTRQEYEYRFAGIKAHNRWLAEFCADTPGRRAGLAQVFLNDVDAAVEEAKWAREHGLMGLALPGDHVLQLSNLYYPRYDPFWATCVELNLPVHRHGLVAAEAASVAGDGAPAVGVFEAFYFGQRAISHMILGGVFERFPKLKFVTTELNSAWAVSYAKKLDYYVKEGSTPGTIANIFSDAAMKALSKTPTEYFAQNCYYGTFFNEDDVAARHEVGVNRMMWGADFPHHEGTSPYSLLALRANFADLSEDEVRQMVGGTAIECYGFDAKLLAKEAERVCPTVGEVAEPLPHSEYPRYPEESVCTTFASAQGAGFSAANAG